MNINIEIVNDLTNITIEGSIDTSNSSDLNLYFQDIIDKNTIKNVNLDLRLVKSINSSGIGKILRFYKYIDEIGGEFKIIHASERVINLFRDINLDKIISVSK